ncbi:MAG TPA: DUF3656 domain-containing protein [Coriobacteriia bacterium]|jgi:putative protease
MGERHTHAPELLAPAGGRDAFVAAVANGADAVYLGMKELNARRGAENFTLEQLSEAARYAHLRGRKVYLTANILVLEHEMQTALHSVSDAWEAGVDAVIVQDLGLMRLIRRELPDVRVHASTQLNAHNAASVEALADLGVARVTLARETSVGEIAAMAAASRVELESFVHGALCFCYSGQCLMSSVIGGRSANRGLCAQPCRLPYQLVDERGHETVCPGAFLLSPKDLAGITVLPDLVRSGVSALKIEGRMKSAEYVALVTGVYRAALDRAAADPDAFAVTAAEWGTLEEAFSRGFTEGSLTGKSQAERMSWRRPNNRGVPVARIASMSAGRATLALDRALDAEDTIEVWTGRGRFAQRAGRMTVAGKPAPVAPAGARAELELEQTANAGDRVFRVANASLLDAARRTYAHPRQTVPLEIAVVVRAGLPLTITASAAGSTATATGPVVELARTKHVTAEEVMEHVGRLGGTPYVADAWQLEIDPAAGIGFSTLHAVRRDALEALDAARLAPWTERAPRRPRIESPSGRERVVRAGPPELVASVASLEAARACLDSGADRVLLAVAHVGPSVPLPAGVEPLLPRVVHEAELPGLLGWTHGAKRVTTGNLGVLAMLASQGIRTDADWGLNVVNPWAAETLADLGAGMLWASPELNGRQLAALAGGSSLPVGALVFGRLELMVAEHCVIAAGRDCDRSCLGCARRARRWRLRDAKGYEFPVTTDVAGRSRVYNAVTLDLSRSVRELAEARLAAVRLELETSSAEEAAEAVGAWRRVLEEAEAGMPAPASPLVEPATTGHFYRGVR